MSICKIYVIHTLHVLTKKNWKLWQLMEYILKFNIIVLYLMVINAAYFNVLRF